MSKYIWIHEIIIYLFRFLELKDIINLISIFKKRDIFWKFLFNRDFKCITNLPLNESYKYLYNEKNFQKTSIVFNNNIWCQKSNKEIYLFKKSYLFMVKLTKLIISKGDYKLYLRIKIDQDAILKDLFIRKSEISNQQILILNTTCLDITKFNSNHIKYLKILDQKNLVGKGWNSIELCDIRTYHNNINLNIIIQESSQIGKGYHIKKIVALRKGLQVMEFE